jgi:hypothetical protein
MSWAPALMLVGIPVILIALALWIDDYLKARPRRNRYHRDVLPPPRAECNRWPDWRVHAPDRR